VKQVDYLLAGVPSLAAMLVFNFVNKEIMTKVLHITKFPPPLVGMFVFFITMLAVEGSDAAMFVDFFEPGVTLLTNFLPVFFMPGLLNAPAALSEIALVDILKFGLVISLGMTAITFKAGFLAEMIMKRSKTPQPPRVAPSNAKFTPWFSEQLELIFFFLTALTGVVALVRIPHTKK